MEQLIPASVIIPTHGRVGALGRTFGSLAEQSVQPSEVLVVDASKHQRALALCKEGIPGLRSRLGWVAAALPGAATQRNQGVALTAQPFVCFCDDDIVFKPDCVSRIWQAIQSDNQ